VKNQNVINAYLRIYTRPQIQSALSAALADHAAGVKITSHSWDGTNTGAQISGQTEDIIETLEACLQALDTSSTATAPLTRNILHVSDFSRCKY